MMKRNLAAYLVLIAVFCAVWTPARLEDYAAFICAGRAVAEHADPYDKVGTIGACQQRTIALTGESIVRGDILPSPLPPYTLGFFALLALLPPLLALVLWCALNIAAYAVMIRMLFVLSQIPIPCILAATVIPVAWASFEVGQITPLILGLIVGTAAAINGGRPLIASLCALGSLCEPHLGLPTCLALFGIERRSRLPLTVGGLFLAVISIVIMPPRLALRYATTVLPRHVQASMYSDDQYSLTHLLAVLGVTPHAASVLGSLQFVMMVLVGAWAAVRIARTGADRDLAVLATPTLAMLGGSHVHLQQIAIASCCCLLLLRRKPPQAALLECALIVLAIPMVIARSPQHQWSSVVIAALIVFTRGYRFKVVAATAAVAYVAVTQAYILMCTRLSRLVPPAEAAFVPHYFYGPSADIETVWRAYVMARTSWLGPVSLVIEAPSLIALGYICTITLRQATLAIKHVPAPDLPRT